MKPPSIGDALRIGCTALFWCCVLLAIPSGFVEAAGPGGKRTVLWLWVIAAPVIFTIAALAAYGSYRTQLEDFRIANNCCPRCGYDLRATPARCPECGRVRIFYRRPPP